MVMIRKGMFPDTQTESDIAPESLTGISLEKDLGLDAPEIQTQPLQTVSDTKPAGNIWERTRPAYDESMAMNRTPIMRTEQDAKSIVQLSSERGISLNDAEYQYDADKLAEYARTIDETEHPLTIYEKASEIKTRLGMQVWNGAVDIAAGLYGEGAALVTNPFTSPYLGKSAIPFRGLSEAREKFKQQALSVIKPFSIEPPRTSTEMAVDVVAGVGKFVAQLAALKKIAPGMPEVAYWELANNIDGGTPGAGAAMWAVFGASGVAGKTMAANVSGKVAKTAVELAPQSLAMGGVTAIGQMAAGAELDTKEILIQSLIPVAFKGIEIVNGQWDNFNGVANKLANNLNIPARTAQNIVYRAALKSSPDLSNPKNVENVVASIVNDVQKARTGKDVSLTPDEITELTARDIIQETKPPEEQGGVAAKPKTPETPPEMETPVDYKSTEGTVVYVNGKHYVLTGEAERKYNEEKERNRILLLPENTRNLMPDEIEKRKKSWGIKLSALARELTGNYTPKELQDLTKKEKGNYIGKQVLVTINGQELAGTIQSKPAFGNVKVKLADGTETAVKSKDIKDPRTDEEIENTIIERTDSKSYTAQAKTVIPETPEISPEEAEYNQIIGGIRARREQAEREATTGQAQAEVELANQPVAPSGARTPEAGDRDVASPQNIEVFRGESLAGKPTDAGNWGKGTYYTTKEEIARGYARQGGIGEQEGKITKTTITLNNPIWVSSAKPEQIEAIAEMLGVKAKSEWGGELGYNQTSDAFAKEFTEKATAKGYDGLVVGEGEEIVKFELPAPAKAPEATGAEAGKSPSVGQGEKQAWDMTKAEKEQVVAQLKKQEGVMDLGGQLTLTDKANVDEIAKINPTITVTVKDTDGNRQDFAISDFAKLIKNPAFNDRIRGAWLSLSRPSEHKVFAPEVGDYVVNKDFMGMNIDEISKMLPGKEQPLLEVEPIEGVTLKNNASVRKDRMNEFQKAVVDENVRKDLQELGITEVSIEPPYKFDLSEQANYNPKTHRITINADADNPTNSLLHELGHERYRRLTDTQKKDWEGNYKNIKSPRIEGYQSLGLPEEAYAETYANKGEEWADTALAKSEGKQEQKPEGVEAEESLPPLDQPAPNIAQAKGVVKIPVKSINVDPQTFQFKREATGEGGVSERYKDVKKWDEQRAGIVLVWERKDGELFIVDGHHRLDIAKNLNQDGINGIIVKEADGISAAEARVMGAMSNLADGKGTAIDAAKLFRDSSITLEELQKQGVSINSAEVKQGMALKKLSDEVFRMVIDERIPSNLAAKIGEYITDHIKQKQVADLIINNNIENAREAELLASTIDSAPVISKTTKTLFGAETTEKSLYAERAKVLAKVETILKTNKKVFGVLTAESGIIEEAGNVLDTSKNLSKKQQADEILFVLEKLVNSKGPVSEAINEATIRYAEKPTAERLTEVANELLSKWTAGPASLTVENVGKIHQGLFESDNQKIEPPLSPEQRRNKGMAMVLTPEDIVNAVKTGKYLFNKGLSKFEDWSKKMTEDWGDEIKPYLTDVWDKTRRQAEGIEKPVSLEKFIVSEGELPTALGFSNSEMEMLRKMWGGDALNSPEVKSRMKSAKEAIDKGLVDSIEDIARQIESGTFEADISRDVIQAAFEIGGIRKAIAIEELSKRIRNETNETNKQSLEVERDRIIREAMALTEANKHFGTESARALSIRNMLVELTDNRVADLTTAKEYAKQRGRELNETEKKKLNDYSDKIAELNEKIAEYEKTDKLKIAHERVKRNVKRKMSSMSRQEIDTELDTLIGKARELIKAGC